MPTALHCSQEQLQSESYCQRVMSCGMAIHWCRRLTGIDPKWPTVWLQVDHRSIVGITMLSSGDRLSMQVGCALHLTDSCTAVPLHDVCWVEGRLCNLPQVVWMLRVSVSARSVL